MGQLVIKPGTTALGERAKLSNHSANRMRYIDVYVRREKLLLQNGKLVPLKLIEKLGTSK